MRRKASIAIGTVLAAVLIAGCVVLIVRGQNADCETVRSMIEYNEQFNRDIEKEVAANNEPAIDEYRNWASRLNELADRIEDQALAQRAATLAETAEQSVPVGEQFRANPPTADTSETPKYAEEYARLGEEFNTNLVGLDQACPA